MDEDVIDSSDFRTVEWMSQKDWNYWMQKTYTGYSSSENWGFILTDIYFFETKFVKFAQLDVTQGQTPQIY